MMKFGWRTFSTSTAGLIVLIITVMACTGRLLPEPYGSFNPLSDGLLRMEEVWQHAVRTDKPACVMFLGDSRTAFSINAAQIGTPSCAVRNYGFPAQDVRIALYLAEEVPKPNGKSKLIVLGLSDSMTIGVSHPAPPSIWERAMRYRWVRLVHVNMLRYQRLLQLQPKVPVKDAYDWNEYLGRWDFVLQRGQPFDKTTDKVKVLEDIAKNYFLNKRTPPDLSDTLQSAIATLSKFSDQVAIFIPPQHPDFEKLADQLAPGEQRALQDAVARAGLKNGVRIIDCFAPDACGISREHFVDPVHLSPEGASLFTNFIIQQLESRWSSSSTSFERP
jgi:hypothetical protein